ncbi:transcription elongation factor GreB [Chitinibacter sp. FCG-7]|uniref:Transcription elongation factor GreB n=1 Tax=Chitinibacter mangrovi TaxID=3153927 RepID=A0AAU7FB66_9NEIS
MSKAFTKENDGDDDELPAELAVPAGSKNYMTPQGWQRMKTELYELVNKERPHVTQVVNWAASNGDRSENADYQYGKRRLREIDRRIRFLSKRLENAEVIDPETREATDQIFFSATVTYLREDGREETVVIVGVDETNLPLNHISWTSPVARALIKAREGDVVHLRTPAGSEELEVIQVCYVRIES